MKKLYVLYDLLGEEAYTKFVLWNSVTEDTWIHSDLQRPFLTVDLEGAAVHLEEENRWREARLLYERCGLQSEDIVLKHAARMLTDIQIESVLFQKCCNDIHALFMESQLSPRRAGDFFFNKFDEGVSYSTISDNLYVLELYE